MPEVIAVEKLISDVPRKRFGKFNQYGTLQYGFSNYGDEDIYAIPDREVWDGEQKKFVPAPILLSGIYRTDNVTGITRFYREPYYITKNPRTDDQQAHRRKYGQAVEAWRGLTEEQRVQYNKRAKGRSMSGWNLFYKEFLHG